jgi:hypothetical protein
MFFIIFGLVILLFGLSQLSFSQNDSSLQGQDKTEVASNVTYCNLPLSEGWKLGNLTFNSLYSFSVGENGEITDIKKIRDNFVGLETVRKCISRWKIYGVPNKTPFVVYFNWKHGKGWIEQRISGNGFTLVMKMEGIGLGRQSNPNEK